jgi:ABC-type antimicrobial peptide transport system ATPase subunit
MYLNETYCKVRICKHLSDSFLIQNEKVQVNQVGLKLNRTYQLLAYADDVNLLGDNMDTIKKNTETLIDDSKEVGLEININKTQYMFLSHHWNAGQNQDKEIGE